MKNSWYAQKDENGLSLGRGWKKGWLSLIFSRFTIIFLMIIIQILFLFTSWIIFGAVISQYIYGGLFIFEVIGLLILINSDMNSTGKISWMLIFSINAFIGICFYFWTKRQIFLELVKKNFEKMNIEERKLLPYNVIKDNDETLAISNYIYKTGAFPAFYNTNVEYFSSGEEKFEKILEELKKAEKFIFLEYFIIEEGYMWGKILEILAQKANEGVEVRVMYDGTCELSILPFNYPFRLYTLGIKCRPWSRVKPIISTSYNYRDHRKILVIDGKVAFNGGVNLADEYINKKERFGHWKDSAICIKGEAVKSFTSMFLHMWNANQINIEDFSSYINCKIDKYEDSKGIVIPFADSPVDEYKTGEMVYMNILNNSKKYVYIMTPYLILDGELETALKFTTQKEIDVRIIMPGKPDKKKVWYLGRSYYKSLIKAGVKIYEYTPGFVHSKVFVSDDSKAVVGTINLDYRSLYHHFECATYLSNNECIKDIKNDFLKTLKKCHQITEEDIKKRSIFSKIIGAILKLIAPML